MKKGQQFTLLRRITKLKKGDSPNGGQLFNTSTSTSETMKKGQQFTLLKRITNSKV